MRRAKETRFRFSPPLPSSRSPPPRFSPTFSHPRRAPSLPAFSLTCSISAQKRKGNGCYAGYVKHFSSKSSRCFQNPSFFIYIMYLMVLKTDQIVLSVMLTLDYGIRRRSKLSAEPVRNVIAWIVVVTARF